MDFEGYSDSNDLGTETSDVSEGYSFNEVGNESIDLAPLNDNNDIVDETLNDTPSINDSVTEFEPLDNADLSQDVSEISDINEWIGDINPNFDPFDVNSDYSNNCGSCAYAVYQRLEGNPDACASADNIGYNREMEALTGLEQISMSPEEIQERLLAEGEGAHAIIGIDRETGPGHWFNAACIDGKVVAIDGQTGEITDWPPDMGDVTNWEMSVRKKVA